MVRTFELRLQGGAVVHWNGQSGEDAAQAYVTEHPGARVVAWRTPQHPVTVLGRGIVID